MKDMFPPPPIGNNLVVTNEVTSPALSQDIISSIILNGDLSKLSPEQKTSFYVYRCRMLGLDPASKPFDLLKLNGKEVLYANKSCAANLRALQKISTAVIEEREWQGLIIIRVRAWYPDGRQHEDEGFATIAGLGGDTLGNARLKATTKATRRAILHLCGLGELDESEVETIPGAKSSAFAEAKTLLASPKPAPIQAGTTAIQIMEVIWKGVDAEVLDIANRVWSFREAAADMLRETAIGTDTTVMVDYVTEDGVNVVRFAMPVKL